MRIPALAAVLAASVLALPACKPMKPRPAAAPAPEPAPAPQQQASGDDKSQSKSHLGKARDAAERTKDRIDAYQQEVSKQADDVFKNP
jgi:hypothetical protein